MSDFFARFGRHRNPIKCEAVCPRAADYPAVAGESDREYSHNLRPFYDLQSVCVRRKQKQKFIN